MKDYSTNSFEQKTFILYYSIDAIKNTITINYADNTTQVLPYSRSQEKILLKKMKQQILNGKDYYKKTLESVKKHNFKDKICKIIFAIYLGIIISLIHTNIITAGLFSILTGFSMYTWIKDFKKNRTELKKFTNDLYDYEKYLNFVNNEEVFSNARIMKPMVLTSVPPMVQYTINSKIIGDTYLKNKELFNEGTPLMDHCIVDDKESIKDPKLKEQIGQIEHEYLENGYIDYGTNDTPLLDVNNISPLTYDDIYGTYQLSTLYERSKGRVLTKVLTYNERH